jgi:hypothetical protein
MSCIELALTIFDHDQRKHQEFRAGLKSPKLRAESLIKYLGCIDDAQRIVAGIEAFDR